MGRESLRILVSVGGAAAVAVCAFLLFAAFLPDYGVNSAGVLLFRFQLGAMLAMALFAGVAIVIYARFAGFDAVRREREAKNRQHNW